MELNCSFCGKISKKGFWCNEKCQKKHKEILNLRIENKQCLFCGRKLTQEELEYTIEGKICYGCIRDHMSNFNLLVK